MPEKNLTFALPMKKDEICGLTGQQKSPSAGKCFLVKSQKGVSTAVSKNNQQAIY